jgi:hypothetical protein
VPPEMPRRRVKIRHNTDHRIYGIAASYVGHSRRFGDLMSQTVGRERTDRLSGLDATPLASALVS